MNIQLLNKYHTLLYKLGYLLPNKIINVKVNK